MKKNHIIFQLSMNHRYQLDMQGLALTTTQQHTDCMLVLDSKLLNICKNLLNPFNSKRMYTPS